ncbi:uncharacterized protein SGFS_057330 [Streptomyces graminofaciens]|uniref:Type VI secretion protein n=1 Tax=Streptomyces graminofaciens TaxID=68212 RepID=A0ABM9SC68_9ACTN|nr:type VI secretion protein [Streptomyces graminofaciens]BBC34439.1 uncharacterized protein SGFS_057330 [Streptomyces graminofaciens]
MRPDERRPQQAGGIPDGLLIGLLALLLGLTLLVWTATGLAALFTHGSWPDGVTFTRTPLALGSLISDPQDLRSAWPDTPPGQLSGYGLFWGLVISQLMIVIVLTVFTVGTLARWKAVRAKNRTRPYEEAATPPPTKPEPMIPQEPTPPQVIAPATSPVPAPRPEPTDFPATAPPPSRSTTPLILGPAESRRFAATQAVRDAEGAALIVTSDPTLWSETKDARAKLGPVLLYDPSHLCDTPARLHWAPTTGCEDKLTAVARAAALLAPIRPTAKIDQAVADAAETLLRSYLHAAAIDGRTIRHLHRWAQGTHVQDAVRTLRTHPKAAPGSAGELESALTSHPERRDIAQELTARALSALSTVNVRESCTPNRADSLALDSFVHEGGTLYVVGDPIEDPKTNPSAMPLLTALASSVVERGRRMAERSSSGRLDPPLTLILDDVAAVAPLPQLPALLTTGVDQGLPTLALLRSREQARSRWPHDELPV